MDIKRIKRTKGFLFDLDGVFIQSDRLLPGALKTIQVLENKSIPFRFLTNTTTKSRNTLHMMLLDMGIKCKREHIFSAGYSGVKTIREMGNPSCVLYISDDLKKDYKIFNLKASNPELIVIGDYDRWDFTMLNQAFNHVMNGAEILALHLGKYYKVDSGLRLDSGSIVKALEYATDKEAIVVGKPSIKFFKAALDDLNLDPSEVLMFGDDLYNDIYGAQRLKVNGILVKTGKYHHKMLEMNDVKPYGSIDSIGNLAKILSP